MRAEQILATRHMGSEEISKRVRILRMTGRNVALECFQTVAGALLQRNSLHISYHGRGNDATSSREIPPQRLIHYRDNWYLVASPAPRKATYGQWYSDLFCAVRRHSHGYRTG